MPIYLRQSTASQEIPLGYFLDSLDGDTAKTGLTIANTDIKLWKTGATTLANKNSGGATHISGGIYYATLDDTDTDTLGSLIIFVHVSTALAIRVECVVLDPTVYDALIAASTVLSVNTTKVGGTTQTARDLGASVLLSSGTGTGQILLSSGTVSVGTNADKTGYTLSSGGIQAIWDALTSALTAAGSIGKLIVDNLNATITSRASQTSVDTVAGYVDTEVAAIKAKTDQLTFTTSNQVDATVNSLTSAALGSIWNRLTGALTTAGSIGKYILDNLDIAVSTRLASADITLTGGKVDVNDKTGFSLSSAAITAIWDKLVSGITAAGSIGKRIVDDLDATISSRLSSASISLSGGAVTVGTNNDKTGYALSSAGVQAIWDKLTSALTVVGSIGKLLVDNINATISSRLASSDITLTAGSVTVGTNSDKTGYALSSAGVDNILDDSPSAELTSVPGATPTIRQAIQFMFEYFKNKKTVSLSTETLFKDNGTSVLGTATVNDDGTTFTKGKMS